MAHNVKSLRRLGRVIGQCEALTPAPNVPEKKRTKGVARLRFFVGQAATAAQRKLYVMRCKSPLRSRPHGRGRTFLGIKKLYLHNPFYFFN
jgi:hypothetical protein